MLSSLSHCYRYGQKVKAARWDSKASLWRLQTDEGTELTADFVVQATGLLSVPHFPKFKVRQSATNNLRQICNSSTS